MSEATININGKIYNVPYEVAEEIGVLEISKAERKAIIRSMQKAYKKLEAELDKLKEENKHLKESLRK